MTSEPPPRCEYPRPQLKRREWMTLNGEWEFGSGEEPRFDRCILVPFAPEAPASGIGEHTGDTVWYRRRFAAPAAECLLLHFGAVDYRATVWVNGVQVAQHEGGHTPFTADISRVASGDDNLLVVRAEDPLTDRTIPRGKQYWKPVSESIFYTATTGIWQPVWLEPLPARHIRGLRLQPDLASGALDFEVAGEGKLELAAYLAGRVVGRWAGPAGAGRMQLDEVVPWSPESPRLYDLEARLADRGGERDLVTSYFGLRTVGTAAGHFLLNGRPYVQRLVLDQGYFPGGLLTAPTDRDLRHDIELARSMGFNGARKHQKLEDPRWLHWADVLGFLVWDEMPSPHQHSAEAERRQTAEWGQALLRDRNHPAVVAWVPANESFGLDDSMDPAARASFLVEQYRLAQALDGSRPVISNDGWEHALTDLCTLHDYGPAADLAGRYRSLESALDSGGRPRPVYLPGYGHRGEPVLVSEFGGLALAGSGGWGWQEVADRDQFLSAYGALVESLMGPGPVQGFCYTQLTDIEQERNGLLTFERDPKLDPDLVRPLTQTPKRA